MYLYKSEWENRPDIRNRISPDPQNTSKAICNVCNKKFCAQLSILQKHLRFHDRDEANEVNENVVPEPQIEGEHQNSPYKYQLQWENNPHYSDWVRRVEGDSSRAWCALCRKSLVASSSSLWIHVKSYLHYRNTMIDAGNPTGEYLHKNPNFDAQVAERELQITAYIVERNYSFTSVEHLVPFIQHINQNCDTINNIKMSRQKAQKIATQIIAPVQKQTLIDTLRVNKFSILIDEMTDITVDKCLCIVVLFWDENKKDIFNYLWDMVNVYKSGEMRIIVNAEHLFQLIKSSFEKANIPLSNILAFSSDTANIMMGRNNSVATRLKENIPGILIVKCPCHMEALCANDAMKVLPSTCEKLIHCTYNYITASAGRLHQFKTLQKLSNKDARAKTVLRPVMTRWTSIYYYIVRNLRLWPVLTKFFELQSAASQDQHSQRARDQDMNPQELYNNYKDPMMFMYQLFLEWTLNKFVKFNEKFQSNSTLASKKQKLTIDLYKFFLNVYMDSNYINSTPVEAISPHDQNHFIPDDEIKLPDGITALMNTYVDDGEESAQNDLRNEMMEFKINCKNYCREAAAKIEERFDLEDTSTLFLGFLHPPNAVSRDFHQQMPDFGNFFTKFPNMMPAGIDVDIINREWTNLLKFKFDKRFTSIQDPMRFWGIMQKFENKKQEPLFRNLCKVAHNVFSIPNSNAQPERIWSTYNYLKNKWRASFKSGTVKAMIQAQEYIKSVGGATGFTANEQMFNFFNSKMYLSDHIEEDNASEGDLFLEREEYNLNANYIEECQLFDKLFKNKERGNKIDDCSDESDE